MSVIQIVKKFNDTCLNYTEIYVNMDIPNDAEQPISDPFHFVPTYKEPEEIVQPSVTLPRMSNIRHSILK